MIKIHKAKVEDVVSIKKLLHETWMSTYSDIYSPEAINTVTSQWHSIELLTKQIQDRLSFFGVAKDGNNIVGMCNASLIRENRVINIQRLHISTLYQRQGIGSLLVKGAINAFPKAIKVELEVEKQNHRAFMFYQKQGFQEVGEKIFEIKNIRIPCKVMEKKI